tara:strand:+ start:1120 stop:1323 length:204 start_codon:yes stop_codon:yes gene_type:complete
LAKEVTHFGKYGNADKYHSKDWAAIKEDPSMALLGTAKWIEANQTCKIYSSVLIKVMYGRTGFEENP